MCNQRTDLEMVAVGDKSLVRRLRSYYGGHERRSCSDAEKRYALWTSCVSFDDLVGAGEQRGWDSEAERLTRFEVDHQFDLH